MFLYVYFSSDGQVKELSQEDEAHILIHALRDANIPKFLAEDVPLFNSILEDLFPGINPPEQHTGVIEVRSVSLKSGSSYIFKFYYTFTELIGWILIPFNDLTEMVKSLK